MDFNYLDTVNMSVTVCDRDGIVLYQNDLARANDGDVVGKNLFDCHNEHSAKMIRHMLETGSSHTLESIRDGRRKLYHRTPWFDASGAVAGLIEFGIPLPATYPVQNFDAMKEGRPNQ